MRDTIKMLREIFQRPGTILVAVLAGSLFFLLLLWLPNWRFYLTLITSDAFSFSAIVQILFASLGSFRTAYSVSSQIAMCCIAILAGINIACLFAYVHRQVAVERAAGMSALGIFLSIIGVGCSACGSVILSSLVGVTASAAIVKIFPLHGLEFAIVSAALLLASTRFLLKKMVHSVQCALPSSLK